MSHELKYFRTDPDVLPPKYGTQGSACFDIYTFFELDPPSFIKAYNTYNEEYNLHVCLASQSLAERTSKVKPKLFISLKPDHRAVIPTGLIFDIQTNTSLRIHIRSGMALKRGLMLCNSVGVVDEDYVDPIFLLVYNSSKVEVQIFHKERLAQGEIVDFNYTRTLKEIGTPPEQKTDRDGGFGSTGVK